MSFGNCYSSQPFSNLSSIAVFSSDNINDVDVHYKNLSRYERQLQFYVGKDRISKYIRRRYGCSMEEFDPTDILIVTWHNASRPEKNVSIYFPYIFYCGIGAIVHLTKSCCFQSF